MILAVMCGDNWHAAYGGFITALPHLFVRFLPTQEWSTGEWRFVGGDLAVMCGDNWHAACGGFIAALPHFVCEIPAYAGMVCGRTGVCVDFGVICVYYTVRFLLSQE